jgi:hypothetical protein
MKIKVMPQSLLVSILQSNSKVDNLLGGGPKGGKTETKKNSN